MLNIGLVTNASAANIFGNSNNNEGRKKVYPNLSPLNHDTVSFSGKVSSSQNEQNKESKELTDKEFEELKKEAEDRINTLPDKIKKGYRPKQLTKNNIGLALKILQDGRLCGNEKFMREAWDQIYHCSKEEAEAGCAMIDKFVETGLIDNEYFIGNGAVFIMVPNSQKHAEAMHAMIDKIASSGLADNKAFIENSRYDIEGCCFLNVTDVINDTCSQEQVEAKCMVIDKIIDSGLADNEAFMRDAANVIWHTNSQEKAEIRCAIIDKFVETGLVDNKTFMKSCLYEDPGYDEYEDEFLVKGAAVISRNTDSKEEAEARCTVIDKIASSGLADNEDFMEQAVDIIYHADSQEKAEIRCKMIDKIVNTEQLINNEAFMERAAYAVDINSQEEFENTCIVFDKIVNTEQLINNEAFMEHVPFISADSQEEAEAKCMVIDKIASSGLTNDEDFIGNVALDLLGELSQEEAEAECKWIDKIVKGGL